MNYFSITHQDPASKARSGKLVLAHAIVETPVFMPVGTQGTVKNMSADELLNLPSNLILGNTYHLYLRPGMEVLAQAQGLHNFANWPRNLLTDSGGFQVFSLAEKMKLSEEGVTFYSHIDGSKHFFSPEKVVEIQRIIGSDIMMPLDECLMHTASYQYAMDSTLRTHRWFTRAKNTLASTQKLYAHEQQIFPIVQGGMYKDLRQMSCNFASEQGTLGIAIGGLSVGEEKAQMQELCALCCDNLPRDKARYLMGVGRPEDLLYAISTGVDMFDCVMPSRNARNGQLFTMQGILNIRNQKWKYDNSPIDASIPNAPLSQKYTKAYLRHLFISKEGLAARIATMHNLAFYSYLMSLARQKIKDGNFAQWANNLIPRLSHKL